MPRSSVASFRLDLRVYLGPHRRGAGDRGSRDHRLRLPWWRGRLPTSARAPWRRGRLPTSSSGLGILVCASALGAVAERGGDVGGGGEQVEEIRRHLDVDLTADNLR